MKKWGSILLLSIYLCASTESYQLLKTPWLIAHLIQHYQEDPETTLMGFLQMHYEENIVLDEDWQQDMQLPFKCCANAPVLLAVDFKAQINLPDRPIIDLGPSAFSPVLPRLHATLQSASIFQPPRLTARGV